MSFTPDEHPRWFDLPESTPEEDFTTEAVALVSTEPDWSNQLLACLDENLLKTTYLDVAKFRQELQKDSRLTDLLTLVGTDANWLNDLLTLAGDSLKKVILGILQQCLQADLDFHIGEHSTHSAKNELIYGLKVIYALLSNKCPTLRLSKNQRLALQSQMLSGIANCTPGFYNRIQEILQSLKKAASPPASIAVILSHIRSELVREAATRYRTAFNKESEINRQWLAGNETHLYNQFTLLAHQQNYGIAPTNQHDPHQLNAEHVSRMRGYLADVFAEKYRLFDIFIALQTHIKSALVFFGYTRKKQSGDSYTIRECQQFTAYLNQLCELSLAPDSNEYLLTDEDGFWIDINWPALNRKLLLTLQQKGYFKQSSKADAKSCDESMLALPTFRQFFEFLDQGISSKDLEQPEGWKIEWGTDWQRIPTRLADRAAIMTELFFRSEEIIKCIDVFGLDRELQRKLLLGFVEPFLATLSDKKNIFIYLHRLSLQAMHSENHLDFSQVLTDLGSSEDYGSFFGWHQEIDIFLDHSFKTKDDADFFKTLFNSPYLTQFTRSNSREKVSVKIFFTIIRAHAHGYLQLLTINKIAFSKKIAAYVDGITGNTLLHHAAARNNIMAVQILLALGVDINHKNARGETADRFASPAVQELLNNQRTELALRKKLSTEELTDSDDLTKINTENSHLKVDGTLLVTAIKHGRINSVRKLLVKFPIDCSDYLDKSSPLFIAINAGHADILELLLEAFIASTHLKTDKITDCLRQCLRWSVEENKVAIFNFLQKKYAQALPNPSLCRNEFCLLQFSSNLITAIKNQSLLMVNALLAREKFILPCEYDPETGLSLAAEYGNLEIVQALLAKGAIDYSLSDEVCPPALAAAAKANHRHVFIEVLKSAPYISLHMVKNEQGEKLPSAFYQLIKEEAARRTLVFEAIERGDDRIDLSGLSANCMNSSKNTLLIQAINKNRLDLVKILLAKKADFSQPWAPAPTPLNLALEMKSFAIVAEFLAAGAACHYRIKASNRQTAFGFILDNYKPDGLAFLVGICEKNPQCWESIFGRQLTGMLRATGHATGSVCLVDRLIMLGNQDPRIIRSVFQNNLQALIFTTASEPISLHKYLAQTAAGQNILRHLDVVEPLSKVVAMEVTAVKPSAIKAENRLSAPAKAGDSDSSTPRSTSATPSSARLLSLPIKPTLGDGNCAFHAIFGSWHPRFGLMVDTEHSKHRQQLVDAVLATTASSHPQRFRLIQECILALVYEATVRDSGINKTHPNLQALLVQYHRHSAAQAQALQRFREAISAKPAVSNFIDRCCQGYQNESGAELTSFQDKYIHVMNNARAEFEQLLTTHGIYNAYADYQTLSRRDLSTEISAAHIAEYTKILGRGGQHLLAQEINLLAEVFNKRIVYHLGVGERTLLLDTFHAEGAGEVSIRHNGVNHFERLDDGQVIVQQQQRSARKKTPLQFFAKPKIPSDGQKTSDHGKRKREDHDLSAHGKAGKITVDSTPPRLQ